MPGKNKIFYPALSSAGNTIDLALRKLFAPKILQTLAALNDSLSYKWGLYKSWSWQEARGTLKMGNLKFSKGAEATGVALPK